MKKFLIGIGVICLVILIYIFFFMQPSNKGNWEYGQERLPHFVINGTRVKVSNLRDAKISGNTFSFSYTNRKFDAKDIDRVWFIVEPFGAYEGVAHTYFVFDFKNQEPVAVSVESRREKGEKYNSFIGLFNRYELIYIWGTETDETVRRVIIEHNKLYMYPLKISHKGAEKLFLQMAKTSQQLESHPRFYNTLTSNCTNELAKVANEVKSNAIPFNIALFLPGYSAQELYKLGFIPNNQPFEEVKKQHYITGLVKKYYKDPNFSTKLRDGILN